MAPKSTPLAHIAVLAIAVLASGCTGARDRFPSLAVRPAERAFGSAQPVDAAPAPTMTAPVPASASVVERVGALKSQAADAQRAFIAARPAAARLAGAARGSSLARAGYGGRSLSGRLGCRRAHGPADATGLSLESSSQIPRSATARPARGT